MLFSCEKIIMVVRTTGVFEHVQVVDPERFCAFYRKKRDGQKHVNNQLCRLLLKIYKCCFVCRMTFVENKCFCLLI